MISINDDPQFQTLIVHQCGMTCHDMNDLKGGVKVSHLEKLFPYLEKHIDKSHKTSLFNIPRNRTTSCKSITRKELKRLVVEMDKDQNGELDVDEFCEFLAQLDDRVKEKSKDPNAVMKVILFITT